MKYVPQPRAWQTGLYAPGRFTRWLPTARSTGRLADLVAFRADPTTCPVDDIPSLRPTFTIVGGRAVYDPETVLGEQS